MNKVTKGALAAGTAAVLLTGGAGTLAYWSDDATVDGGSFASGHLAITPVTGTGCTGWTLDRGEDAPGVPYDPATMLLVPGDVLTQNCEFTLDAEGEHMRGTVSATPATTPTGALAPYLTVDTAGLTLDGEPVADGAFTEANDGQVLGVNIAVTFDPATTDPASMDVAAALESITVTAEQIHA